MSKLPHLLVLVLLGLAAGCGTSSKQPENFETQKSEIQVDKESNSIKITPDEIITTNSKKPSVKKGLSSIGPYGKRA